MAALGGEQRARAELDLRARRPAGPRLFAERPPGPEDVLEDRQVEVPALCACRRIQAALRAGSPHVGAESLGSPIPRLRGDLRFVGPGWGHGQIDAARRPDAEPERRQLEVNVAEV